MSPLLTCQGLVFATMVISAGSLILFDIFKEKERLLSTDPLPALKSCLSSSGSGCGDKKKKKVKFAEDVRESRGDGEVYRRRRRRRSQIEGDFGEEEEEEVDVELRKKEVPANHMALYSGILRDQIQVHRRIQFSY